MRPPILYAKSGDVRIGYQVTGTDPVDVVWAPGIMSHLDLDWEFPGKARFIERFSSFCRLIRFDKRGTGLSDRPTAAATLEERIDDIRAVMDAVGSDRAVIFGVAGGAPMACLFAATYPQRTRGLIVWGGQARWVAAEDYPWGPSPNEMERLIADLSEHGPSIAYLTAIGAGLGQTIDPAFLEWHLRYARAAVSPSAAAALERTNAETDIRDILPTIRVPTLVMNRTGDPVARIEAARDLAAHIPGARFVDFPGNTHLPFIGDPDHVLAEIQEFVTGMRGAVAADRFLVTMIFLDVVESTARAAQLGDMAWRDLLHRYYTIARRELADFGGVEVDTAGDGFLARFDGPTRAIRCAVEITQAVRDLGLRIRAGLHTGEVELMQDGKVSGIAVHVGARVAALAGSDEVLVSSTVKDLVAGSGIEFEDRGVHPLKGVPGEWRLFAVKSAQL